MGVLANSIRWMIVCESACLRTLYSNIYKYMYSLCTCIAVAIAAAVVSASVGRVIFIEREQIQNARADGKQGKKEQLSGDTAANKIVQTENQYGEILIQRATAYGVGVNTNSGQAKQFFFRLRG